jgi:hypothetical protein
MKTMTPTNFRVPPDELDTLLRDYFRSEMPEPWPAAKYPTVTVHFQPQPRSFFGARSRSLLALAAAVAVLIAGLWQLGGASTETAATPATISSEGAHADPSTTKGIINNQIKREKGERPGR